MLIKNKKELSTSVLRGQALEIVEAGLLVADPRSLLRAMVRYDHKLNLLIIQNRTYKILSGRIFVVGGGKAAGLMAEALEGLVGADNITAGVVNSGDFHCRTDKIRIIRAGHPSPDKKGLKGVEMMLDLKEKYKIDAKDLVICLLSGGASAMMPAPVNSITLAEYQLTNDLLIKSGASITEINTVRKHLSRIQGGRLARHFAPAQIVSLIISDVVDNNPEFIGSGPTVMDPTIFRDAYYILEKYFLFNKIPKEVSLHIERGCHGMEEENPKKVEKSSYHVIGDNKKSLEAMSSRAKSLGFSPIILSSELSGSPTEAVRLIKLALSESFHGYNAIILGGETTPVLPSGHGRGGRNQHFALANIWEMRNCVNKWAMASVATDGFDYISEAAGAIVDYNSFAHAQALGLDLRKYLSAYNSFEFFQKTNNSLVVTGNTGANVGDVVVYLFGD